MYKHSGSSESQVSCLATTIMCFTVAAMTSSERAKQILIELKLHPVTTVPVGTMGPYFRKHGSD